MFPRDFFGRSSCRAATAFTLPVPQFCGAGANTPSSIVFSSSHTKKTISDGRRIEVIFPVNVNPSQAVTGYELADDIVLKNSTRS